VRPGKIITFYSYKGGVGRSFTLANVAAVLATWGARVLCIDWDLEAPGLHHFFSSYADGPATRSLIDLLESAKAGSGKFDWRQCVASVRFGPSETTIDLIAAGRTEDDYIKRVHALDWQSLYEKHAFGDLVEKLRREWVLEYDFVLIDSRTGLTDIAGICTIHLPHIVVSVFTANRQSMEGTLFMAKRINEQRDNFFYGSGKAAIVPLISRWEEKDAHEEAIKWLPQVYATLAPSFDQWKDQDVSVERLAQLLRVPYKATWNFGERLAVVEEKDAAPGSVSYHLSLIAAFLSRDLHDSASFCESPERYAIDAEQRIAESIHGAPPRLLPPVSEERGDWEEKLVDHLEKTIHEGRSEGDSRAVVESLNRYRTELRNIRSVMVAPTTPPPTSTILSSPVGIPWDQLLTDIHKRQVLPIIGPALVTVDVGDRTQSLINTIVPDFAAEHGIDYRPGMTLNEAACKLLERDGQGKRMAIYNTVTYLIADRAHTPVPQGLLDLAAITDFDAFFTTTCDGVFTKALMQTRPGWSPAKGRAVLHPTSVVDVPQPLPSTFLYHLLGATDQHASFAIWEEDYMEYLAALLMGPQDNLKNLIGLLRNRSLLILGSPYEDWFTRFFWFIAKRSGIAVRNDSTGGYLVDDIPADSRQVFYFDKVIGSPRILPIEPVAFVRELRRRWQEKFTFSRHDLIESLPSDMPRGYVFISYASEDKEAAFTLALGLQNAGIPVWLDKQRLEAGTDYEMTLRRAIKQRAALFLSVISFTTEAPNGSGSFQRFAVKERQWAAERHEPGLVFYVPIVVSSSITTMQNEPQVFRGLQSANLPGGNVTPEFLARIAAYMDEYREKGEITHTA